jgi:hypothetical protein
MQVRQLSLTLAFSAALVVGRPQATPQRPDVPPVPASLTPEQFWKLSTDMSEPAGFFRSENLVSNEHTYQYVIPALKKAVLPGGIYLGVAPDQNFTYMAAIRPRLAFILDIRRGNLLEHLMYKALFELSADRADFVSRLFSKPRPAGLTETTTVSALFAAYARVNTQEALYRRNLAAIKDHLVKTRAFPLSSADLQQLESIYFSFFWEGPGLRYSSPPPVTSAGPFRGGGGNGGGGAGRMMFFPSYEDLIVQTDWDGTPRSYLASEDNFRFIKGLEQKNLIVPVVGNFAGSKALRSIGRYLRERMAPVTAFYVSNVEQYLYQDGIFDTFAKNVSVLPTDTRSTFIRSVSSRFGYEGPMTWSDGRATALYPIQQFVRDFELGLLPTYFDVNARSK